MHYLKGLVLRRTPLETCGEGHSLSDRPPYFAAAGTHAQIASYLLCSVLEPGRTLTLAERGGAGAEVIVAATGFRLVATMNPGGDYGKKELSPALSNRFTQARRCRQHVCDKASGRSDDGQTEHKASNWHWLWLLQGAVFAQQSGWPVCIKCA